MVAQGTTGQNMERSVLTKTALNLQGMIGECKMQCEETHAIAAFRHILHPPERIMFTGLNGSICLCRNQMHKESTNDST